MKKYGLIGYPLGHSFSEKYFQNKFKQEGIEGCFYDLYPIESCAGLVELVRSAKLSGLNVTIPHKKRILPFLDVIDESAHEVGAVNCIKIERKFNTIKLIGYNTDIYGFEQSLKPLLKKNVKALVLGNGGAALSVQYVLRKLGIPFLIVTRREDKFLSYEDLKGEILTSRQLIVNTTPLGTFPHIEQCPTLAYDDLGSNHILYDLVYNPEETLFLKKGKEKKAIVKNGYDMLVLQAEKSWKIWQG